MDQIPPDQRDEFIEEVAFTIPAWFIEVLTEFKGQPIELDPFQIKSLNDTSTLIVTNKCRQTGGSMTIAERKLFKLYRQPGYRADIVSINLREATDKIKYIRNLHDTLPTKFKIPITTDNQLSIGFHKGAKYSVVNSIAASTGVRGGSKEIVFDEFAHIENADDLFLSAAPAMIHGDYGLEIVSTPNGLNNLFAKIYLNEVNEEGIRPYAAFSRHHYIWLDFRFFVKPGKREEAQHKWEHVFKKNMDRMRELVLEYATDKLLMYYHIYPYSFFLQEFCGSFINDENAVFSSKLIRSCVKGTVGEASDGEVVYTEDSLEPWTERPDKLPAGSMITMGVDFGESDDHTDKTAVHIIERRGDVFMHRYHEVLRKADYPDISYQEDYIAELIKKFRPDKVLMDETGMGRPIVPGMRRRELKSSIEGITFTVQNKEEMILGLKTEMERGKVWILEEATALQGELGSIRRTVSKANNAKYEGQPYDDNVWAFAMALKAASYTPFVIYRLGDSR